MKTIILIELIFLFAYQIALAQSPLIKQWDKRFGGFGNDLIQNIYLTPDEGYLLTGTTYTDTSFDVSEHTRGGTDFWIVKTNATGQKLWDKRFGGENNDIIKATCLTTDHGYALAGWSNSGNFGDKSDTLKGATDYWVAKIDSAGNKLWDHSFGCRLEGSIPMDIKATNDGGYIIGGYSSADSCADKSKNNWDITRSTYDYWIIKLDALGNKQWDKTFGGNSNDYLTQIALSTDGGYLFAGYSSSGIGGNKTQANWGDSDYWIIKTDNLGNIQWDKRYGGANKEELFALANTPDGGYILAGNSESGISGDKTQNAWGLADVWLVKIDDQGILQWEKDFGGSSAEELQGLVVDSQGNYLFAADSYSPISGDKTENNQGLEQTWVLKLSQQGNKLWDKTIRTGGHDETSRVLIPNEGCFTFANFTDSQITGYQSNYSRGLNDYWMIKFCDTTFAINVPAHEEYKMNTCLYPNPFNNLLTIEISSMYKQKECLIVDIYGKQVYNKTTDNEIISINTEKWSSGIYFLIINTGPNNLVKKIVKE